MDEGSSRKAPPGPSSPSSRLPRVPRLPSSPALPPTPSVRLGPGARLGRYELALLVREDDAGTVWLAHEEMPAGSERIVGLRVVSPTLASDQRFRELLRQEVKLAGGVGHPNVAQILELGKDGGTLFLASEWVEGETFAELRAAAQAKRVPMPTAIALRVLADACAGLHAAHLLRDRNGALLNVVHGDVSAASIVVGTNGVARVIDLGLRKAKARHFGGANVAWSESGRAPGHRIDRHADVWGIGAILAQTLQENSAVTPPILDELVLRARSIDPVERFATAAEMQGAIDVAMMTLGIAATHATVASFLHEHLGDRIAGRADVARTPRAKARSAASIHTPKIDSIRATVQSVRPSDRSARLVVRTPVFGDTGSAISHTPMRVPLLRPNAGATNNRRRAALFAGGFCAAVLGIGGSGYLAMHARGHGSVGAVTASMAPAAPPLTVSVAPAAPGPPAVAALPPRVPPTAATCPAAMVAITASSDAHDVHAGLAASFCLDAAPVTTDAYKSCSDAGDCKRAATENRWAGITAKDRAAYDPLCHERDPKAHAHEAANCVDREMAAVYCKARGGRLPTEAESTYATRGLDGTPRAPGDAAEAGRPFSEWSLRPNEPPTTRSYALGFRCARTL